MSVSSSAKLGTTNFVKTINSSLLYPDIIVTSGLQVHLNAYNPTSYQGTGSTWVDLSSSPTNATLYGSYSYTYPYIRFAASSGAQAEVPSSSKFAFGTGDFTWEMWVYGESTTNYIHLLGFPYQSTAVLKKNASTYSDEVYFYSPSWSSYSNLSNFAMSANTWYHLVFKRESGVAYAYLNSQSKGVASGFSTNFSQQAMTIHPQNISGELAAARYGAVRIYDRGLTELEIIKNFNIEKQYFGL